MKYLILICLVLVCSCKNTTKNQEIKEEVKVEDVKQEAKYKSFGAEIIADDAIAAKSMLSHYKMMNVGDSIPSKMKATVIDVCQAKGCWMVLDLGEEKTARVKFKDYAFFMPKDIKGKKVIVNGKAFVNEMPVDELQHYAKDAGKSEEEIAAITESEKTFSFEADGVLLVE